MVVSKQIYMRYSNQLSGVKGHWPFLACSTSSDSKFSIYWATVRGGQVCGTALAPGVQNTVLTHHILQNWGCTERKGEKRSSQPLQRGDGRMECAGHRGRSRHRPSRLATRSGCGQGVFKKFLLEKYHL